MLKIVRYFLLGPVREILLRSWFFYLKALGVDLSKGARVSLKANIDFTNPKGIHIAEGAYIAFDASLLSHCYVRGIYTDTYILSDSFIGARSIIMPGVKIGPNSIVAAGSIVTRDVPPNCVVAGNPAKVIRENIKTGKFGRLIDEN